VFSVGGGRIAEVFIGETQGYFNTTDLTPEDVAANWDTVTEPRRLQPCRRTSARRPPCSCRSSEPEHHVGIRGTGPTSLTAARVPRRGVPAGVGDGSRERAPTRHMTTAPSAHPTWSLRRSTGSAGSTTPASPASTGPSSTAVGPHPGPQRAWHSSARWPACPPCSTWSGSCSPAARSRSSAHPSSRPCTCAHAGTDHVWCQLFSEPGAGSDLGSLTTRAERDGDRFIVNGQKVWCSGGRYSNWGILMARTRPRGGAEARRDLVLPARHGPPRRRGAPAPADDR
jgi:hypothetical protein